MKALNYLRQAKANWAAMIAEHGRESLPLVGAADKFFELADSSEKFILPKGGRIFDDELRGVDELARLPFARCLIEYESVGVGIGRVSPLETERCSRRIVYVEQIDLWLFVMCMFYMDRKSQWVMYPLAAKFKACRPEEGSDIEFLDISRCGIGKTIDARLATVDFLDEIRSVFELIEALSCSNVQTVALPGAKLNKSAARRGALRFDEYKTLVVRPAMGIGGSGDSDRRAPREHLRRGHIRRLPNGHKIWIQSCVVAAGAVGRVNKNYDMRGFA